MSDIICVTNRAVCEGDFLAQIEKLAKAHPHAIILREKDLSENEYKVLAKKVIGITEKYNTKIILHTYAAVAIELGCKAVHMPLHKLRELDESTKNFFTEIGASCHSADDVAEATKAGCTYVTVGHIYETDCKKGLAGRGTDFLRNVCETATIPVYAIGGISTSNYSEIKCCGASGACVMSSAMKCENADEFLGSFQERKMIEKKDLLLYAVTDRHWVGRQTLEEQIEDALKGGVTILQLREKELDETEFIEEAKRVKKICSKYNVPLIINDNIDVALKSGADGVHVGIEDMPVSEIRKKVGENFIIGATAKTVEQAQTAEKSGADYIGVGAVFPSPTKTNAIRITNEQLSEIISSVSIPAVAIGGITEENITQLKGGNMDGVAVVSAIFSKENIEQATKALKEKSEEVVSARTMKTALTIAGSDSSGGAGIQADIKTMTMNGVFAMSAITALTAQNTTGVRGIAETAPDFLKSQLDAVFEDIFPDAVKIGMVSSTELIEVIAERLEFYKAKNVVVDPVMVSTSGSKLMQDSAVNTLVTKLFPLADLVTPNISEAEILSEIKIQNKDDMLNAAEIISNKFSCAVLLKGGHSVSDADDLLYADGEYKWFIGKRIDNPNTHGTGCTLSSAIASNLAKGYDIFASVERAKEYISEALAAMLDLGKGSGPLKHSFNLNGYYSE